MIIIERKFHLESNCSEKFLDLLSEYFDAIEKDPYIETFAIVTSSSDNSDIIARFVVENIESWDKRMEQDYVREFLAKTHGLVHSVDTDSQTVIKWYTKPNA